jgi:phage portal protein BeeE
MREKVELISLRPDWLIIESYDQTTGAPYRYRYSPTEQGNTTSMVYLREELVTWLRFNPLDRWRGMSPLHACAFAIDTLNSYAASNKATLDNGVTPSGVLSTEQVLSDEPFERLREQFKDRYAGATNSGGGGGGGGGALKVGGSGATVTSGAGGNGGSGIVVIFY